ncbi:MAG: tRNA (guanosine(37)-N1)-methyltransferase TrmD, partial [Bacteroidota bacterium]
MRIDIISAVPNLLDSFFNHSILQRAQEKGIVQIAVHDLRQYGLGKYKQIDDYAFGGGAGMVLKVEPIIDCITQLQQVRSYDELIYLTPDGETLNQSTANTLSLQ